MIFPNFLSTVWISSRIELGANLRLSWIPDIASRLLLNGPTTFPLSTISKKSKKRISINSWNLSIYLAGSLRYVYVSVPNYTTIKSEWKKNDFYFFYFHFLGGKHHFCLCLMKLWMYKFHRKIMSQVFFLFRLLLTSV